MTTTAAARWAPSAGVFAPTTGFDHRLFDEHANLRPEVRAAVMEKLDQALRVDAGLVGSDWQDYLRVYLAGGSASEWAGNRPNDTAEDLDILIGVAYAKYRGSQPTGYAPSPDRAIDSELNLALRGHFNDPAWHAPFGGTWSLTGFVNAAAWDIKVLKPYAAWDISNMTWAVRPPHLPSHSLADFDPALLREARAVATMARAILRLPEPGRTRQARALWEHIHSDRSRAFSAEGEGWQDAGNIVEKYLAYAPGNLLGRIRDLAYSARTAGLNGEIPEGTVFHHIPSEGHFDPHVIVAQHPAAPDGEHAPREAGHIKWWGDTGSVSTIRVHPDFQRRGLATEMFRRAKAVTPNLHHSDALSEQGRQWAPTVASSDGDRHVTCEQGHEHWGAYGAAGLLIRHKGDDGKMRYLLQKRSDGVNEPGTWSVPGGAIGKDETPEQGAMREAREELGPLPRHLTHHHTVRSTDCGDWAFHTVVMDAGEHFMPRGGGETEHETAGAGWFTPKEVGKLDLHPAFARSWDTVRRSRGPQGPTKGATDLESPADASTKVGVKGYDLSPRTGLIYLDVPPELIRQVPGGVNDSHITVVYLGKGLSDEAFQRACLRAQVAAQHSQPLHGVLHGVETFPPSESSEQRVPAFVPAYIPGIGALRRELEDLSASQHTDYRPHLTLAYLEPGDELPPPHPPVRLTFTHLSVKRGDDVVHFPLGKS